MSEETIHADCQLERNQLVAQGVREDLEATSAERGQLRRQVADTKAAVRKAEDVAKASQAEAATLRSRLESVQACLEVTFRAESLTRVPLVAYFTLSVD